MCVSCVCHVCVALTREVDQVELGHDGAAVVDVLALEAQREDGVRAGGVLVHVVRAHGPLRIRACVHV